MAAAKPDHSRPSHPSSCKHSSQASLGQRQDQQLQRRLGCRHQVSISQTHILPCVPYCTAIAAPKAQVPHQAQAISQAMVMQATLVARQCKMHTTSNTPSFSVLSSAAGSIWKGLPSQNQATAHFGSLTSPTSLSSLNCTQWWPPLLQP